MFALYVFCAVLGVPLVALFALGGNDVDADVDAGFDLDGDFDAGGDIDFGADVDTGFGGTSGDFGDFTALVRRIPISSYTFFLAFFGVGGLLGTLVGLSFAATLLLAVIAGVTTAFVNTAFFSFLRNTESDSRLTDNQLEGRVATVSVPIDAGKRGRVWLDTGDERVQLTAGSVENEIDASFGRGEQVVIVSMDNGVAKVMAVDPELSD
jgi:membrane protein implicated in regulation of membrane protease activity